MGLISFCLLKCVQMDVLVMVALETSRTYRAWPGQSLSCCQSREEARQVQMFSLESERFFCSAHSRNSTWSEASGAQHPPAPFQGSRRRSKCCQPGSDHPRRSLSLSRQRGGGFSLREHFIVLNNFPCFYVETQIMCNTSSSLS